jgi:hypothetical protein
MNLGGIGAWLGYLRTHNIEQKLEEQKRGARAAVAETLNHMNDTVVLAVVQGASIEPIHISAAGRSRKY